MRWLLDTDTCIEVLRGREPASEQLRRRSPDDISVSAMTVAELRFGALNSSAPERTLAAVEAFLAAPIAVLPFDRDAAAHHADLRRALRHSAVGERDLVIAATAWAANRTVVTGNRRPFQRIPDLPVEDWTDGDLG